jgi:hypothetical protein
MRAQFDDGRAKANSRRRKAGRRTATRPRSSYDTFLKKQPGHSSQASANRLRDDRPSTDASLNRDRRASKQSRRALTRTAWTIFSRVIATLGPGQCPSSTSSELRRHARRPEPAEGGVACSAALQPGREGQGARLASRRRRGPRACRADNARVVVGESAGAIGRWPVRLVGRRPSGYWPCRGHGLVVVLPARWRGGRRSRAAAGQGIGRARPHPLRFTR